MARSIVDAIERERNAKRDMKKKAILLVGTFGDSSLKHLWKYAQAVLGEERR
jgi:hypothetical protein